MGCMSQLAPDQRIVKLPMRDREHTGADTPRVVNMIGTAIVALEAFDTPKERVRAALDCLNAKLLLLQRGVPNSLAGTTEVVAMGRQISCREIQLTDIRKATIDHVRALKSVPKFRRSAWMKQKTMEWARSRGWSSKNADAADALAVCHTIRCFDGPSYAANETPLFGGLSQ